METGRMKMERGSMVIGNVFLASIPAISKEGKREKGKKERMIAVLSQSMTLSFCNIFSF